MAKVAADAIQLVGLKEFRAAIVATEGGIPAQVRIALNEAMALVVGRAKSLTPVRTGAGRGTIKASSTANYARISEGGSSAPYMGFLDYGNKVRSGHGVGRGDSQDRPFIPTGRILYPAFRAERTATLDLVNGSLVKLARAQGLAVTTGGV